MNHAYNLTCVDGGYGWGETNQKGYFISAEITKEAADYNVRQHTPGGWTIEYVGLVDCRPGLSPIGGHYDS